MLLNKISNKLDQIGMSKKLKGYNYIRASIELIIYYGINIEINYIYEYVAQIFWTNGDNVERNIRYAIEKTWEKGNVNSINKMFGFTVDMEKGKPTNKEFLFLIADTVNFL